MSVRVPLNLPPDVRFEEGTSPSSQRTIRDALEACVWTGGIPRETLTPVWAGKRTVLFYQAATAHRVAGLRYYSTGAVLTAHVNPANGLWDMTVLWIPSRRPNTEGGPLTSTVWDRLIQQARELDAEIVTVDPAIRATADLPRNENKKLCSACPKPCCTTAPGSYHPDQFGPDLEGLEALIRAGHAAIDWWDDTLSAQGNTIGDLPPGRSFFVRPSTVGTETEVYYGSNIPRPCSRLGRKGCTLPWHERPHGCRELTPLPSFECGEPMTLARVKLIPAWLPFQAALIAIGDRLARERNQDTSETAEVEEDPMGMFGGLFY